MLVRIGLFDSNQLRGENMTDWLTLLLSALVLTLGYSQWKIANQRVLVDLFVRRLDAYNKIRRAVVLAMHQAAVGPQEFSLFCEGKAEAEFLFGEDVLDYLQALHEDFAFLHTYTQETIDSLPNRDTLSDERIAAMLRIDAFFQTSPGKFAPYMRMDQKNTRPMNSLAAVAGKIVKSLKWTKRLRFGDRRGDAPRVDFLAPIADHSIRH